MDDVRRFIVDALAEKGLTLKDASLAIGRNHAYLQQFIQRHVPDALPEVARAKLALVLGCGEEMIGGRPRASMAENGAVYIPEHDVRASAGPGAIVDGETEIEKWPLPKNYVRNVLSLRSSNLAIIEVIGDSMDPTLKSGDKIMIDLHDKNVSLPGVFALYDGDATVVKRVERIPGTDTLRIRSDNPLHGAYDVPVELVHIAGRVVWFGRRL